ncbi:MAG: DUF3379 domain-containing protein [Candidatus Polarisedimenticolaceae bacterium]|nr:DUF3379 domain-containing protein [Candidatus Polarisedimenticolaceae bacterium]
MNCNAIRKLFTTDPRSNEHEALQHLQACKECSRWMMELQKFEMLLLGVMQEKLPLGLQERLIQQSQHSNTTITPKTQSAALRWWQPALAIAASLLLVVGLIGPLNNETHSESQLAQQMLSWLSQQQPSQYLKQQAPVAEVDRMFNEVGAKLVADIGTILHCKMTQVAGHKVGHFVVDRKGGPVSIMLMADGSKKLYIQNLSNENHQQIEHQVREAIR